MKTILFLVLLSSLCTSLHGQTISRADSIEITAKINDWNTGWKEKNAALATKWYGEQAEFTNAFGHSKTGKHDIENFMKEVFALPFVMAGDSRVTQQKLIPLDSKIVLVITSIERTGQQTPDKKELGPRQTTHHRIFKKESEWLIVSHLISDARDTQAPKH